MNPEKLGKLIEKGGGNAAAVERIFGKENKLISATSIRVTSGKDLRVRFCAEPEAHPARRDVLLLRNAAGCSSSAVRSDLWRCSPPPLCGLRSLRPMKRGFWCVWVRSRWPLLAAFAGCHGVCTRPGVALMIPDGAKRPRKRVEPGNPSARVSRLACSAAGLGRQRLASTSAN